MKHSELGLTGVWRRSLGRSLIVPFVALAMGSLAGPASAEPVHGGSMTMSLDPEPSILVSALNSSSSVYVVSSKMFDGLVSYDEDFNLIPRLAESWEASDDGLTITFHLRDGVKFHDGEPLTSADVQYTFMEILKQRHPRGKSTLKFLEAVETPDDLTAVFKLSTASPYIMRALAGAESPILPKHVYEGTDVMKNPANTAPIGTGPFKFGELVRGSYLILLRNDDYWDGEKPYLDQLIVRFIADSASRAAALESGEVQYGAQYVIPLSDVERMKANPNIEVSTDGWAYNTSVNYMDFNMRRPQWQDVRVRQAIVHAIDKDFIVDAVWHGFATPADGPITNRQREFHTTDVPHYDFDLEKSAALLDEAGYPVKDDGTRFSMTIDYSPSGDTYAQEAEILKQNLAKIGVEATIRAADGPTYLRRIWTDNDFDVNIFAASNIADPVIGLHRFYWSENIKKGTPYSNGSGYASEEMDSLLEAAQVEVNLEKRKELYKEMQQLALTDLSTYPIVYINWFSVFDKSVKGLNQTALGVYENFANVYIEQ